MEGVSLGILVYAVLVTVIVIVVSALWRIEVRELRSHNSWLKHTNEHRSSEIRGLDNKLCEIQKILGDEYVDEVLSNDDE